MESYYEKHANRHFIGTDLPFIFHRDGLAEHTGICAHWHENPEFLLCTDGSGQVLVGADWYPFEKGTLMCVPSGELHRIVNLAARPLFYDCLIVDINFCGENGLTDENMHFAAHITDDTAVSLFEKVVCACDSADAPLATLRIRTAVMQFLLNMAGCHTAAPSGDKSGTAADIKKVLLYVKNHYDEPISLAQAADVAGFSRCYFAHKFKEATGVSFLHHLNAVRIEKASALLREGVSVTEACFRCGFKDLSYFSRTFKKITGQAPSRLHTPCVQTE